MKYFLIIMCLSIFLVSCSSDPGFNEEDYYPFTLSVEDSSNTFTHIGDKNLDAPAGKYGFLTVKDGQFEFEDGTPVKFWGVNTVNNANFPSKSQAETVSKRLAKLGVNNVRIHWIEFTSTPNGIWKKKDGVFVGFDEDELDRMERRLGEEAEGVNYDL